MKGKNQRQSFFDLNRSLVNTQNMAEEQLHQLRDIVLQQEQQL